MHSAVALRRELSARNQAFAISAGHTHDLTHGTTPSVIFGRSENGQHGNFHPASYKNICNTPTWAKRLTKVHSQSRKALPGADWRWMELDAANSSDALLMNIFCHRRSINSSALSSMLGVSTGLVPEFGFKPRIPLTSGRFDCTEVDMKLGDLLVEAKLTEANFQTAPWRLIERYRDLGDVFAVAELPTSGETVNGYQLIRGILAAHSTEGSFCVLCDARRQDLVEIWYSVIRSVKGCDLRCRLKLLTWQGLVPTLPNVLQRFVAAKYGIVA